MGSVDSEIVHVRLATIIGTHRAIDQLDVELDLPPLKTPLGPELGHVTLSLLQTYPIQVTGSGRGRFRCIAGVRLYRLATVTLDHETLVPAFKINKRLKKHVIQRNYLTEIFYGPALFGLSAQELRLLIKVWERRDKLPPSITQDLLPSKALLRLLRTTQARARSNPHETQQS